VKWHSDSVDTSSLNVLLQWLTAESNYNNYRGGRTLSKGKTKDNYCTEISDLIKRAGIKVEQTKNAVRAKINEIEAAYHKANDWINNTGAGVECQIMLQNYVKTICPYYYDVHEVFMDRASSFAQFTSERNVGCDDDSSESGTFMMDSTMGDWISLHSNPTVLVYLAHLLLQRGCYGPLHLVLTLG
jgi:hypothetical protein